MFISHNMANIFLASHILLLFHSPKGSWSKSAKYEKLGKYWSYCTRNRAITNAYVKKKLISCITLSLSFFLLIFLCTLNITKNQKHLPSTFTSNFYFDIFVQITFTRNITRDTLTFGLNTGRYGANTDQKTPNTGIFRTKIMWLLCLKWEVWNWCLFLKDWIKLVNYKPWTICKKYRNHLSEVIQHKIPIVNV